MNELRRVVRLNAAEAHAAAQTLARAFMNDPLQSYTFPDPEERAQLSIPHFESLVRLGLIAGEVWTIEGALNAVSVLWPPERKEFSEDILAESGFTTLPNVIGESAFGRFLHVIEHMESLHKRDMPVPHWYVMVLGVEPSHQGQGLGSLLLKHLFERADAQGLPCYLETAQPANVSFYTANGFKILVHGIEPISGLPYWTFRRDPEH